MSIIYQIIIFSILAANLSNQENMIQKSKSEKKCLRTEWTLNQLTEKNAGGVQIKGKPVIVKFKNANAVSFNGSSDAIFLESMPIAGCNQFTIEVIIKPASGGNFEQRFLHIGEVQGDRVLLELRATPAGWYFDGFVKVGDQEKALIDPQLLHPFDQWYHVAYIIDNWKLETYVNGKKELEGNLGIMPLQTGKTSIGVRQNEVSWFKGDMYKIRITPQVVKPIDFMKH